jgi:hypothetical protein
MAYNEDVRTDTRAVQVVLVDLYHELPVAFSGGWNAGVCMYVCVYVCMYV